MQAGRLRHRVTIQAPTETRDAFGEAITTWADVATVWAAVEPLRGREFMAAQQNQAEISHRVRVRYRSGIAPAFRLLFEGRVLQIGSIINPSERDAELQLMCREMPNG